MKLPTLTIGISAYNEKDSIGALLSSIVRSRLKNISLSRVIVVSDLSTDGTDEIVKSFSKSLPVRIIRNRTRQGKLTNLSKLLKSNTSDVFVILDADVILATPQSLHHLVTPLLANKNLGLVSGNPHPLPARTWVERAITASFKAYDSMRYDVNSGHNVYSLKGCSLALSKKLTRLITPPKTVFADDGYIYFTCLKAGLSFHFASPARVDYRLPATLTDHIKQNRRYLTSPQKLAQIFGPIVSQAYSVPMSLKLKHFFRVLISDPISTLTIFILNLIVKLSLLKQKPIDVSHWSRSQTTSKATL